MVVITLGVALDTVVVVVVGSKYAGWSIYYLMVAL